MSAMSQATRLNRKRIALNDIYSGSLTVPGGYRVRNLLILVGIGILSASAWTVSAQDGTSWYGSKHPRPGHGGLEYHMRHGGGHFATAGQLGMEFPTPPGLYPWEAEPGPAPVIPAGGLVVGGSEHKITGHLVGANIHSLPHVAVQVEGVLAVTPQPPAFSDGESDQAGAATAQLSPPTASPAQLRPPGGTGPGRPVSGWSSPGLPGPGRPGSPQW